MGHKNRDAYFGVKTKQLSWLYLFTIVGFYVNLPTQGEYMEKTFYKIMTEQKYNKSFDSFDVILEFIKEKNLTEELNQFVWEEVKDYYGECAPKNFEADMYWTQEGYGFDHSYGFIAEKNLQNELIAFTVKKYNLK